jgi:rubrerythrin
LTENNETETETATTTTNRAILLHERGQRRQWQTDDLPWELGTKLCGKQREGGARLLSQIYWGEYASYLILEQLLPITEDKAVRIFLEGQIADEKRHLVVFERYLELLGGVAPRGESMTALTEGMLALSSVTEKMIGLHILIEGIALEIFHEAAQEIADPLLQTLTRRVFVDEARHVAFGTNHLRRALAQMPAAERDHLAYQGGRYAFVAASLVREERSGATAFGLDLNVIQRRTQRVMARHLQQIGLPGAEIFFR